LNKTGLNITEGYSLSSSVSWQ